MQLNDELQAPAALIPGKCFDAKLSGSQTRPVHSSAPLKTEPRSSIPQPVTCVPAHVSTLRTHTHTHTHRKVA
jgi:hypothetical protein